MFIAKDKIRTNIGEYIIYMFQIEDLIRASKFNKTWLEENIVNKYDVDETKKEEIKNWYFGLSDLMEEEKITQKGHFSFINNKINELFDFHLFMLQSKKHNDYIELYKKTEQELLEFSKLQKTDTNNVVLLLTSAIYGYMLLKLQGKTISQHTANTMKNFGTLLSKLSEKFRIYETGEKKIFDN